MDSTVLLIGKDLIGPIQDGKQVELIYSMVTVLKYNMNKAEVLSK